MPLENGTNIGLVAPRRRPIRAKVKIVVTPAAEIGEMKIEEIADNTKH
jgi:hypothetical protein